LAQRETAFSRGSFLHPALFQQHIHRLPQYSRCCGVIQAADMCNHCNLPWQHANGEPTLAKPTNRTQSTHTTLAISAAHSKSIANFIKVVEDEFVDQWTPPPKAPCVVLVSITTPWLSNCAQVVHQTFADRQSYSTVARFSPRCHGWIVSVIARHMAHGGSPFVHDLGARFLLALGWSGWIQ
jgi:hypothetical protein